MTCTEIRGKLGSLLKEIDANKLDLIDANAEIIDDPSHHQFWKARKAKLTAEIAAALAQIPAPQGSVRIPMRPETTSTNSRDKVRKSRSAQGCRRPLRPGSGVRPTGAYPSSSGEHSPLTMRSRNGSRCYRPI